MKITNITVQKTTTTITLSADIQFNRMQKKTLFFTTDKAYEKFVAQDASCFVAALLLPCMKRGEDIEVDGVVSQQFLMQTKKIMQLFINTWHEDFQPIHLLVASQKDVYTPKAAASFFSAGVDSFYTYLKHKERIDHFIFVHGFDIPLANKPLFVKTLQSIKRIAKSENKTVIPVLTNAKDIIEPVLLWDFGHGGALAAVALFLRKNLGSLYIAGALRKDQLFPYGTHPKLDPLWGTETLEIIHDGTEYDRLDKVMHVIGKSDVALANLHVCAQNRKGKYNCSICFKCLWTMMTLICADALKKSKTFQHEINLEAVSKMRYNFTLNYHLAALRILEVLEKQQREPALQEAIKKSLDASQRVSVTKQISGIVIAFDRKYNRRRLYQYVFTMNKEHDRRMLFKMLAKGGIIK